MRWRALAATVAAGAIGMGADAAALETVEVPRDLGTLPRAAFDWVATPDVADHPAGDLLVVPREQPRRVEAYDLRGRLLWRYALPGAETFAGAAAGGDLVVLASDRHVTAVEKRSGRRRWLWTPQRGSVVGDLQARPGTFLVRVDLPAAQPEGWRERRDLVLLDAATGRPRWRTTCPETMCTLVSDAGDELLVDVGGGFLRFDPSSGAPGPRVEVRGKLVAAASDVALTAWAPETGSIPFREHGPIELTALSISRGRPLWKATVGRGDPTDLAVRRVGDAWVVLSAGRLDVLDAATGTRRRGALLPEIESFERTLGQLPDGRVVALVRTGQWRPPLSFVLVADVAGPHAAALWTLPDDRGRVRLVPAGSGRSIFDDQGGFGVLRAAPDPAPRTTLALGDEVRSRVERLMKDAAAAGSSRSLADDDLDLRVLRRLDRAVYEDAALARLDGATPAEVRGLALLLEAPPATAKARDALSRTLARLVAELPRAPRARQLELMDGALSLLETLPGQLAEQPARDVGRALAGILRETMAARTSAAASAPVVDAARRYLDLLWRAPYPDLDGPLRAAVAAVGRTTTGTAACAPGKRALSEEEAIWADLTWEVLGLRTDDAPVLLKVPARSDAAACVEVSTLGGPVITGSEKALADIKAARPGRALYTITSSPLSPEGKAALDGIDHGDLGNVPVREATWGFHIGPLNAGGHRAVIARVAGRWRVVTRFMRWVS